MRPRIRSVFDPDYVTGEDRPIEERGPKITNSMSGRSFYLYALYPEARKWSGLRKWWFKLIIETDAVLFGAIAGPIITIVGLVVIGLIVELCRALS